MDTIEIDSKGLNKNISNSLLTIYIFITIIACTISVSAIQDINITVAEGYSYCIAVGTPDNYICNSNETLSINGTADYDYFLTPYIAIDNKSTSAEKMVHILKRPFEVATAVIFLIIAFIVTAFIGIVFLTWINTLLD